MLKGESLIELTDVRTGKKEFYKDTNMVTNALSDVINCASVWMFDRVCNVAQYMYPIYEKLLGGVVLFPEQLEENPDKYWAPYNLDPVGFASNVVNTGTDKRRGNFNVNESEPVLNDAGRVIGYKYVWDFNTAQGNGQIASVCLTHPQAGYNWYGCNDSSSDGRLKVLSLTNGISYLNTEVESWDNIGFTMLISRSTGYAYMNNFVTGKLYRERAIPFNSVGICDLSRYTAVYNSEELFEEVLDYQNTEFYKHNKSRFFVAISDTEIFGVSNEGNASGSAEVYWIRINVSTLEYTEGVWSVSALLRSSTRSVAYSNGYLFWVANDRKSVYKINLSNVADVKQIVADNGIVDTSYNMLTSLPAGVILGDGFYISDDKICKTDEYGDGQGNKLNYFCGGVLCGPYLFSYRSAFYNYNYYIASCTSFIPQYLATINNLSSPVTKTADKTMKITYTLTEVQEP